VFEKKSRLSFTIGGRTITLDLNTDAAGTDEPTRYIALLPLTDVIGELKYIRSLIDEADLCDDIAVVGRKVEGKEGLVAQPCETHLHISLGYKLPPLTWPLGEKLKKIPGHVIKLDGFGLFKSVDKVFHDGTTHSYDCLYANVMDTEGKYIHHIQDMISKATGTECPYGEFKAHVTLAYLKSGTGDRVVKAIEADLGAKEQSGILMSIESISWAVDGDRTAPLFAHIDLYQPAKKADA